MLHAIKITPGVVNKLKIIFGKPEVLDQSIRPELEKIYLPNRKSGIQTQRRHKVYLTFQIAAASVIVFLLVLLYQQIPQSELIAGMLVVIITLVNCGALLEQRRWIYYLEYIRLLAVTGYLSDHFDNPYIFAGSLIFVVVAIWPLQKWYLRIIYHPYE